MRPPFEPPDSIAPALFITADYELFLGASSGSLQSSILTPVDHLATLMERYERRLIIFVDILMVWRMMKEAETNSTLRQDIDRVTQNLQSLLKRGHSLQLHLHTQWLDAEYKCGEWIFPSYKRYSLSQLSADTDAGRWDTVAGCVTLSKKMLEDICREIVPNYTVTAFRAGGLCVQPFAACREALIKNGLTTDSSVAPRLHHADGVRNYDFRNAPDTDSWHFNEDPCFEDRQGPFEELPILTFDASLADKASTLISRRCSKSKTTSWGDGRGLPAPSKSLSDRLQTFPAVLTYDYWPVGIITRELSAKIQQGWKRLTLLGHPKYLSPYGLEQLEKVLSHAKESGWA